MAAVLLLGFFYPLFVKALTKQIPLFKNLYVAGVYSAFFVFPSIYYGTRLYTAATAWIFIMYIFLEMLVSQVALDTKDVGMEKKQGFLTLPAIIGTKASLDFLFVIAALIMIIFGFLYAHYSLPTFFLTVMFTSFFVNLPSIYWIRKAKKVGYILIAGKFFALLILSFFASYIF